MNRIAVAIFRIVDVFFSFPQRDVWLFPQGKKEVWESNHRELFEYLLKNTDIQPVAILNPEQIHDYPPENVIRRDNIFSLCKVLLCASVVFLHHGTGDLKIKFFKNKKRIYIHLGHGGLMHKKKGFNALDAKNKKKIRKLKRKVSLYSFYFVNSQLDKMAAIASFGFSYEQVKVTGMARSSSLLNPSADSKSGVVFDSVLDEFLDGRKLIAYAPTWREDGSGMYAFNESEIDELAGFLKNTDCVLGFDGHQYIKNRRVPEGDCFLDLKLLKGANIQNILRRSDVLITDYSSVWVDYLLLDKPVVGFFHDWNEYGASRGFQMDYMAMFPGRPSFDFSELLKALDLSLLDGVGGKYLAIKGLVHQYTSGDFCERAYLETQRCLEQ